MSIHIIVTVDYPCNRRQLTGLLHGALTVILLAPSITWCLRGESVLCVIPDVTACREVTLTVGSLTWGITDRTSKGATEALQVIIVAGSLLENCRATSRDRIIGRAHPGKGASDTMGNSFGTQQCTTAMRICTISESVRPIGIRLVRLCEPKRWPITSYGNESTIYRSGPPPLSRYQ